MIGRTLILLFFTQLSVLVFAQKLPSVCSISKPSVLQTKTLRESDVAQLFSSSDYCQSTTQNKHFWVVYSDRDNNVTYTTSTGRIPADTLAINDKLRIAKIENNRALVYEEPVKATAYPEISPKAICKGWVPMNQLLLWDICLSDEMGVYQKAMLCLNVDTENGKYDGYGYKNPQILDNKIKLDPTFRIYYIMKYAKAEDGRKLVLLATQSSMLGISDNNLYAWVPEDLYAAWNQRSCIEPTWRKNDVGVFEKEGFIAEIHDLVGDKAYEYEFKLSQDDPEPYEDDEFYRWGGNMMRFPILDATAKDSDLYHCQAFVGNPLDTLIINAQKFYQNRQNVNIILLLDATRSMDVYSESVYQAIKGGCEYFDGTKYKIKIGVMLYRDQADGDYETEWLRPTDPNATGLLNFIKSGGRYGYKSDPRDTTNTESLFYGMMNALNRFKNPTHSNVLVVVGDCGNNPTDMRVTKDALVSKIVEKDVNVVGFQVRNQDRKEWALFNTDIQPIIRESLQKKSDKIMNGSKVITKLNSDCSGYVFSNNLDQNSSLFMAEHRHALSGKEIAPKFLMEIMTEVIGGYAKKVDELFDVVHEYVIFGSAPTNGRLVETWLKEKIGSKVVSGVIAFRGITSKKEYDRHVWMPNVFFNHDELVSLVANLQPLYLIARTPKANDRAPFLDAVKQCIEKMAPGTDLKTDQLDDILKRAMGINEPTPILRYPIMNVLDNQKVEDTDYRAILSDFKMKYEKLDWILKNKNSYKYKMEYNGITYYWIAVQDMP